MSSSALCGILVLVCSVKGVPLSSYQPVFKRNRVGAVMGTLAILALLPMALMACGAESDLAATPTRSGEEVLATAYAAAEATKIVTVQTLPATPVTPSATVVTSTPTPSATATPDVPIATSDYNAFVREGPDESFPDIDFFLQGQRAEIIGRYDNLTTGTWYYIHRLDAGRDGWVWSGAVTVVGNLDSVPYFESPPLPDGG
jgi:hypothetical protein